MDDEEHKVWVNSNRAKIEKKMTARKAERDGWKAKARGIFDQYSLPEECFEPMVEKAWEDGHAFGEQEMQFESLIDFLSPIFKDIQLRDKLMGV